jgi:hypothetical protein
MRGKVLSYDDYIGSGLISGDDGVRYTFTRGGLMGGAREAFAGQQVDFEVADAVATNIYITSGAPLSLSGDKNKIVAALLAFVLGWLGIHKFYLGKTTAGVLMLLGGTIGWITFGFVPPLDLSASSPSSNSSSTCSRPTATSTATMSRGTSPGSDPVRLEKRSECPSRKSTA